MLAVVLGLGFTVWDWETKLFGGGLFSSCDQGAPAIELDRRGVGNATTVLNRSDVVAAAPSFAQILDEAADDGHAYARKASTVRESLDYLASASGERDGYELVGWAGITIQVMEEAQHCGPL